VVLGEAMIFLWGGCLLLLGILGFFAVLLGAVARILRFVLRIGTPGGAGRRTGTAAVPRPPAVFCENPRCGHTNRIDARFCARCGVRIRG
jgi:hypothetical protein